MQETGFFQPHQHGRDVEPHRREHGHFESGANPSRGKVLVGNLASIWRYRAGDNRIVRDIGDEVLIVLVVGMTHRTSAYRHR